MSETLDGPIHPDPHGVHRRRYARTPSPRRRAPRSRWLWLLWLPLAFVLGSVVLVGALRWWSPPMTAFMATAWLEARLAGARDFELRQRFVPLAAQPAWLAVAVIAAEDQKFPRHRGFDVAAMRAAYREHQQGARLRGASTITQQLAK
ncbi:MAG: transglycosylase domain-containing protein, partial [Gammaproteobacteria bacterium]